MRKDGSKYTLLAAIAAFIDDKFIVPFIDKPYNELSDIEQEIVQERLIFHFLRLDFNYCQERLAPALFQPLVVWLQTLGITSLTLIPCGYLIDLPLTTLVIDTDETLGDKLPTSIAPSARSLIFERGTAQPRTGVYALRIREICLGEKWKHCA